MTQRNIETFLESQLQERLQTLLRNTRTEIVKSGFEPGTKFGVEIGLNGNRLMGWEAAAPTGDGGSWLYPSHVYADLAGTVRGKGSVNLELKVIGSVICKEGVTLDFTAMKETGATAD